MFRGLGDVTEEQQLHFLEICAGSHRLTDAAIEHGMNAHAIDVSLLKIVNYTKQKPRISQG